MDLGFMSKFIANGMSNAYVPVNRFIRTINTALKGKLTL